jgi:hypothetical protein
MMAKLAIPIVVVIVLVGSGFYGVQRAADNAKAGPACKVLIEVDLRGPN